GWPPLLANFGVSLVERALLDAFCRRHGCTIGEALRGDGLGLWLGELHPELAGMTAATGLPTNALLRVSYRHTVGLADPLTAADLATTRTPNDGLPVDLQAVIRHYGAKEFKIKVAGETVAALDRLERVVAVIVEARGEAFAATLDGNEFFASVDALQAFWQEAQARPGLRALWPRLRFLEQPLHRDVALGDDVARALPRWTNRPALLIDESGGEPADLRRALDLGYVGVSHKNCKGVIHGVANRCLLAQRGGGLLMSGEDLSNVGPVALPQDLAVQTALGNASVERNGHHYFAGLSGWPSAVQTAVLETYPDLYARPDDNGWPTLQITAGEIDVRTAGQSAFGGPWDLGLDSAG